MKTILVAVVGTVGLVATPAVAGSKKPSTTKPTVEQKRIAEADAAKPAGASARLADAGLTKPTVESTRLADVVAANAIASATPAVAPASDAAGSAELASPPELLAIPVLPADNSNAFTQLDLVTPRAAVLAPGKKAKPEKAPILDLGDHYVLGGHKIESTTPREEVVQFVPRGLTAAQVSTVVQQSSADLQVCWAKLPAAHRADHATAMMKLSIDDAGKVTAVDLGGDVPASTHACITSVVKRWQFPTAETRTVIETGVSMRSL